MVSWASYVSILVLFTEPSVDLASENYIQNRMDDPLRPGALGLGQDIASLMINCFALISQITPLATAAVADSYLGHYKTLRACFW